MANASLSTSSMAPIILIGTHRSGTSWLAQVFSHHPSLACWIEPRYVWEWGNNYKPDDVLTSEDATSPIIEHIRRRFYRFVKQHGKQRLFEKTPSNCLRLPFIRAVYPEAKIIHVIRDGRSVFRSADAILNVGYYRQELLSRRLLEMLEETPLWAWPAYVPRITETVNCKLRHRPLPFWGPRPRGWREWVKADSRNVVLAKQWVATISQAIRDGDAISSDNYYRFYYEDLMIRPQEVMRSIVEFAELADADELVEYVEKTVDPTRQGKWRELLDEAILEEIRPYMESTLNELGYEW